MRKVLLFRFLAAAQFLAGFGMQGALMAAQEGNQSEKGCGCGQKPPKPKSDDIQVRLSSQLQAFFTEIQTLAAPQDKQEALNSLSDLNSRKIEIVDAAMVLKALQEAAKVIDARSSTLDSTAQEKLYQRFEICCNQFDSGELVVTRELRAPQAPQTAGLVTSVGNSTIFPPEGSIGNGVNSTGVPGDWYVGGNLTVAGKYNTRRSY